MTEAERVTLYNDLCDFRDDLKVIHYPPQTKQIDILTRAISYVRGDQAKWLRLPESVTDVDANRMPFTFPMQCSSCKFSWGRSDFLLCPKCGSRMKK